MALAQQYVEKMHYTEAEYCEFERTSFGRWELWEARSREGSIFLPSGGVTLALADVYALIGFGGGVP
jgi:hypothetical protein